MDGNALPFFFSVSTSFLSFSLPLVSLSRPINQSINQPPMLCYAIRPSGVCCWLLPSLLILSPHVCPIYSSSLNRVGSLSTVPTTQPPIPKRSHLCQSSPKKGTRGVTLCLFLFKSSFRIESSRNRTHPTTPTHPPRVCECGRLRCLFLSFPFRSVPALRPSTTYSPALFLP